ncbi:MAG TPA: ROK family protein [Pyrinomonadaceae bacterium]|jgi:glucokinase|nr:ROK family protein [Pyrinomonadaceae bacterium]
MSEYVLAADMGGTNLRMAAIGPDGNFLDSRSIPTPTSDRAEDIVEAIVGIAKECRDSVSDLFELRSLGLAAAALVSAENGRVLSSPNLHELDGHDLAGELRERLGIAVVIENDANAAAIGEHWLGSSKGFENSIMVTLGTGVGGGLILNGGIFRGSDGTAGEIGHVNVEPHGVLCGCGSYGCLEQYASATAIVRMARELTAKYPDSSLNNSGDFSSLDVYNAGVAGDELSLDVFELMGFYLGNALAGLVNVLNPDVITIGGGVASGWDLYADHVRKQIKERAFQHPAERVKLVRAELGNRAGILGAAWLALNTGRANSSTAQ